ncbi:hypothetical protein IW261DRAFT_1440899 [Armillaria novae-zelandiae]|uniref:Uncharacterized protein n=1 Tax=Armillaria novae-zelandiae TaxID=153914 RepID=A0AA39UI93_9AGAR|nr:hypothetical protein IW261DRAFT_1440899 [Armillaria novae-zelandiae]
MQKGVGFQLRLAGIATLDTQARRQSISASLLYVLVLLMRKTPTPSLHSVRGNHGKGRSSSRSLLSPNKSKLKGELDWSGWMIFDRAAYMRTPIPLLPLCSPKDTVLHIVLKGEEWRYHRCIIASVLLMWDHAFMLNYNTISPPPLNNLTIATITSACLENLVDQSQTSITEMYWLQFDAHVLWLDDIADDTGYEHNRSSVGIHSPPCETRSVWFPNCNLSAGDLCTIIVMCW